MEAEGGVTPALSHNRQKQRDGRVARVMSGLRLDGLATVYPRLGHARTKIYIHLAI